MEGNVYNVKQQPFKNISNNMIKSPVSLKAEQSISRNTALRFLHQKFCQKYSKPPPPPAYPLLEGDIFQDPSGLKLWVVLNPVYTVFYVFYVFSYTYIPVIKFIN